MRPNTDPTIRTNDQTTDLTLTPTPEQVDMDALTIPAAAERLGLTSDAIRMRLKRGTLAGRKVEGRWVVLVPGSNADPTSTERTQNAQEAKTERLTQRETQRSAEHPDATNALIDRLLSENAYLRATLDAEIEARRRADHLVAGLMERLPELTAGGTNERPAQDAIHREDEPAAASEVPNWRRWLRRMTGAG
jgi:hypothetical protein